jgi:hypothetical protein
MVLTRSQAINHSSKKAQAHFKLPGGHHQAKLAVAPNQKAGLPIPPQGRKAHRHPPPRNRGARRVDLELATWNTWGYDAKIDDQVTALLDRKDVLGLTECYGSIQT